MAWKKNIIGDFTDLTPRINQVDARATNVNNKITNEVLPSIESIRTLDNINRESVVLNEGTHIINAEVAGPVDVEIQGRTLIPLGNSNLEAGKRYVLADDKTKVIVDKNVVSGVGKFVKGQTTNTTADFKGKVAGSLVANPHTLKYRSANSMPSISEFTAETGGGYGLVSNIDELSYTPLETKSNGFSWYVLFSFDIIEQIERNLGVIPGDTKDIKVSWLKENVSSLACNWYGYGSSAGGNRASLTHHTSVWSIYPSSHTNNSTTKITKSESSPKNAIDSNGNVHFLAYSEPSDGVTPSTLTTDYVDLNIVLKSTAQLNTRVKIIKVENFEGKIAGSTVGNPHLYKSSYRSLTLEAPNASLLLESPQNRYNIISSLNESNGSEATAVAGRMSQQLFSFNIVESVERHVGEIPSSTLSEKVEWIKQNISRLILRWYGKGVGPLGNKCTIKQWRVETNSWLQNLSHSNDNTSLLTLRDTHPRDKIDLDGFSHFLAHAEASDGTIASTIHTDYVELEIELKPTADFQKPKIPLYEVSQDEYDKILVAWNEEEVKKRYRYKEENHVEGVELASEGENIIDLYNEFLSYRSDLITGSTKEFSIGTASAYSSLVINKQFTPNTAYTFSWTQKYEGGIGIIPSLVYTDGTSTVPQYGEGYRSVTTDANKSISHMRFSFGTGSAKTTISNFMFNVGSSPKPFTPHNPSKLFIEDKLGAIADKRDVLFKEDGKWKVRKLIGSIDIGTQYPCGLYNTSSYPGYRGMLVYRLPYNLLNANGLVIDFSGKIIPPISNNPSADKCRIGAGNDYLYMSLSNSATGFRDSDTLSNSDISRFLNGWKYVDGSVWHSVTGNGQTATAQQALDTQPTDYTPMKLYYTLSSPIVEEVDFEGDISLVGATQVSISNKGASITDAKFTYANNIRTSLSDLVSKAEDNITATSVQSKLIVDILARMKAQNL